MFSDDTSQRQTALLDLIVGVIDEDKNIHPLILSACIFPENETAEKQVGAINNKVRPLSFIDSIVLQYV